jgi:hypothetical protein
VSSSTLGASMRNLWPFLPFPVMLWAAAHVQDYPHGPTHWGWVFVFLAALAIWVGVLVIVSVKYRGNRSGW